MTAHKLWDFNFHRGLVPVHLGGFVIGKYSLCAVGFHSGAMRISREKSLRRWSRSKIDFTPVLLIRGIVDLEYTYGDLKILQNRSKNTTSKAKNDNLS